MYVKHSGWNEKDGAFSYDIFVDENKTDYAVHFANGTIARQNGTFHGHTADWNNDGDVYPKFGAWFEYVNPDGSVNGGTFFTPEDLVSMALDAKDPDASRYGPRVVEVTGITLPQKRLNLEDRLRQTEARAFHQDVERNRKMAALGIRHPGEPWAR